MVLATLDDEPLEGHDVDAFEVGRGSSQELETFVHPEELVLRGVGRDGDRDPLEEGRTATDQVEVAEGHGVEGPRKERVGGALRAAIAHRRESLSLAPHELPPSSATLWHTIRPRGMDPLEIEPTSSTARRPGEGAPGLGGAPVARPLFEAACLVGLGSWAGSEWPGEWVAGRWGGPGTTALILGLWGALAPAHLPRAARALLLCVAILRATLAPHGGPEAFVTDSHRTPGAPSAVAVAEGVPGPTPGAPTPGASTPDRRRPHPDMVPVEGRWQLVGSGYREDQGLVLGPGGSPLPRRVPTGSVRRGEGVLLLGPSRPVRAVQAPDPSTSAPDRGGPAPILARHHALDTVVRVSPSPWPASPWPSVRSWTSGRLRHLDPESTRPLVRALLIGESASLGAELKDLFTRLGLRHLLALSGLHVGLLAVLLGSALGAMIPLLSGRRLPRSTAVWTRALPILIYIPLAGAGAPVTRAGAALVFTAWASTIDGGRRPDGRSLWGAALLYECTLDPGAGSRIGVQLSYLATLGLMTLAAPWARLLESGLPKPAPIAAVRGSMGSWVGALSIRTRSVLVHGIAASLAASLPTAPVILEEFGEWSWVGLVFTAPCVPFLGLLLAGGWCEVLVPGSMGPLLDLVVEVLVNAFGLLDSLPGTPHVLPIRPFLAVAAVAVPSAARLVGYRLRPIAGRLATVLAGALCLPWAAAPSDLRVDALDVGHGTAVVLRAPGVDGWIFDAGSRGRRGVDRRGLLPYLRRHEIDRPVISLSHLHRDHASALPWIVERFPPDLWVGPVPPELTQRLPGDCEVLDPRPPGAPIPTRGPLAIEVLRGTTLPGNEGSRSLSIELRGRRILLCGDAEEEGLARVLRGGHLSAPVHLLLLPHHGSEGSHLGRLLEKLDPREVWISADPPAPVIPELDRRGLSWRCTALHGPLRWPRARDSSGGAHSGFRPRAADGPSGDPPGTEPASLPPGTTPRTTPRGSEARRSEPDRSPPSTAESSPPAPP